MPYPIMLLYNELFSIIYSLQTSAAIYVEIFDIMSS